KFGYKITSINSISLLRYDEDSLFESSENVTCCLWCMDSTIISDNDKKITITEKDLRVFFLE
ncbi:MAG: hypothetical protein JG771_1144, partial [Methermicoccus sp.]|nr:hypothetical protein [Methermicoccus sp.]